MISWNFFHFIDCILYYFEKFTFQGTEIQFYAATTLHTKILRCWSEVPPESHDALKENILEVILAYSKGPKIVTNRLCISVSFLFYDLLFSLLFVFVLGSFACILQTFYIFSVLFVPVHVYSLNFQGHNIIIWKKYIKNNSIYLFSQIAKLRVCVL